MQKKFYLLLFASAFSLLAVACTNPDSWRLSPSGGDGGGAGSVQKNGEDTGGLFGGGKKAERPVYDNQDRNMPCWQTSDCLDGLVCKSATKDTPGACSMNCESDSDCGNGFLCRPGGSCQRDCADPGEKCSERRECCFNDSDGDKETDVLCVDIEEDVRCRDASEAEKGKVVVKPVPEEPAASGTVVE